MKYGLISLDFRRFPLEKCFAAAAAYGFQGVEIWGGRPHAYPRDLGPAEVREILNLKKKYRLETPMYTPNAIGLPVNLCSSMAKERAEGLQYHKQAVDACAALEIPAMLVVADHPGYGRDVDEVRRCFSDEVGKLALYAAGKGVTIAVEPLTPMESPVVTCADDCARLVRDTGADNLRFVLDIVPPAVVREPLSDYFQKLPGRICHVHICGSDGATDAHLNLDEGVLSVRSVLDVLKACGYKGYAIAELYSVSFADPERAAANAARFLSLLSDTKGPAGPRPANPL